MEGACRSCGKCSGHINSETMRRLLLENFTRCNISNKVATFSLFLDRTAVHCKEQTDVWFFTCACQAWPKFPYFAPKLHCNPLKGNYRVELLHREILLVITGNDFTEYSFLLFWLHFFPVLITLKLLL